MSGDGMPGIALPGEQDPDLDGGAIPVPAATAGPGAVPGTARASFPQAVPASPRTVPASFPQAVPAGPRTVPGTAQGTVPARPQEPRLAGTVAGTVLPAVAGPQHKVSTAEHLLLSLRDWAGRTLASQKKHESFWRWLWCQFWEKPPDSLAGLGRHLRSRQWLEVYMTGWLRAFCEWENIAWGVLIAGPVTAVFSTLIKVAQRQSRSWVAFVIAAAAFTIWTMTHH